MVSPRPRSTAVRPLVVLLLLAAPTARGQAPARPMARLMPAERLSAALEFDGLDAHAAAWKGTAAYAILRETPAGATIADVARQVADRLLKGVPDAALSGDDIVALHDHLVGNGFALALYDGGDEAESTVLVLRGLGRKDARGRFDRALRMALGKEAAAALKPTTIRGREVYRLEEKPQPAAAPAFPIGAPAQFKPLPSARYIDPLSAPAPVAPAAPLSPPKVVAPAPPAEPAPVSPPKVVAPAPPAEPAVPVAPPEPPAAPVPAIVEDRPTVNSWWFEGDDLVLVSAPSPDEPKPGPGAAKPAKPDAAKPGPRVDLLAAVLDAIEGKRPDATAHPGRVAALAEGGDLAGFEADGLFFIEAPRGQMLGALADAPGLAGLPLPVPIPGVVPKPAGADPAKALGLDGITRVVGRWGFHGKGLLTAIRVEAPAPRKGLAGLLDGTTFHKDRLPPIPRGAGSIVVGALDPAGKLDAALALVKSIQPDAAKELDAALAAGEKAVRDATGIRPREDLLGRLRPSWCIYAAPGGLSGTKPEEAAPVIVLGIDDAAALGKTLDTLADRGNAYFRTLEGLAPGAADPPSLALERLPAPERGYRLTSPSGLVLWLRTSEPTVALGKSSLVLAANPIQARAAVAAESGAGPRWAPSGELAKSFECLPTDLAFLWVGNPHDSSWPEMLAGFPTIVQFLGNLADYGADGGDDGLKEVRLVLGIPRPGGFRLRLDRAKGIDAQAIQSRLFPSVLAASVDARGLRIIAREALPFACSGADTNFKVNFSASNPMADKLKFTVRYLPGIDAP